MRPANGCLAGWRVEAGELKLASLELVDIYSPRRASMIDRWSYKGNRSSVGAHITSATP